MSETLDERVERQSREAFHVWQRHGAQVCRTCKTAVLFAKNSETGKTQIIDAKPDVKRGNIFLIGTASNQLLCRVMSDPGYHRDQGVPLHLDHHATCPDAASFREGGPNAPRS